MTQHRCLGLNAADSPTDDAKTVNHRRVRIGSYTCIRVSEKRTIGFLRENDPSKVLDVDLVDDAGAGRNNFEVIECALAPAQELVAFFIALIFEFGVDRQSLFGAERVRDNGVVNDQLSRA